MRAISIEHIKNKYLIQQIRMILAASFNKTAH